MIIRLVFSLFATLAALSVTFNAFAIELTDAQRDAIVERIQPAGMSCMEGEATCGAATAAPVADTGSPAAARSGEDVYNTACLACHSTGAAGAPKLGDAPAWAERIAKGMDVMYASGIEGISGTGMMAKGGCMSCSDDEVRAAVDHMVEGSQ